MPAPPTCDEQDYSVKKTVGNASNYYYDIIAAKSWRFGTDAVQWIDDPIAECRFAADFG